MNCSNSLSSICLMTSASRSQSHSQPDSFSTSSANANRSRNCSYAGSPSLVRCAMSLAITSRVSSAASASSDSSSETANIRHKSWLPPASSSSIDRCATPQPSLVPDADADESHSGFSCRKPSTRFLRKSKSTKASLSDVVDHVDFAS